MDELAAKTRIKPSTERAFGLGTAIVVPCGTRWTTGTTSRSTWTPTSANCRGTSRSGGVDGQAGRMIAEVVPGGDANRPGPRGSAGVNGLVRFFFRMGVRDASGACYRVQAQRRAVRPLVSCGYCSSRRCCTAVGAGSGDADRLENRWAGKSKVNSWEAARSIPTIIPLGGALGVVGGGDPGRAKGAFGRGCGPLRGAKENGGPWPGEARTQIGPGFGRAGVRCRFQPGPGPGEGRSARNRAARRLGVARDPGENPLPSRSPPIHKTVFRWPCGREVISIDRARLRGAGRSSGLMSLARWRLRVSSPPEERRSHCSGFVIPSERL